MLDSTSSHFRCIVMDIWCRNHLLIFHFILVLAAYCSNLFYCSYKKKACNCFWKMSNFIKSLPSKSLFLTLLELAVLQTIVYFWMMSNFRISLPSKSLLILTWLELAVLLSNPVESCTPEDCTVVVAVDSDPTEVAALVNVGTSFLMLLLDALKHGKDISDRFQLIKANIYNEQNMTEEKGEILCFEQIQQNFNLLY